MRPTTFLQGVTPQEDSSSILESSKIEELPRGGCPSETVPIRRITKEDLIRTKLSSNIHPFTQETPSSHVNPKLYGDNKTRLFTRWTADNYQTTGCYNTLCPGFVQISNYFSVDSILDTVSIYNGIQRQLKFSVFQDQFTGNWMFFIGHQNHFMGYWPRSIFQNLGYYANSIEWGGATHSLVGEENMPQMGSGHFPEEGYRKACFFHRVHLIPTIGDDFINPSETDLAMISNKPNCYRVLGKDLIWSSEYAFYFGGPGGTCGS
ncbi:hypothetical protein IFM89_037434 [Coptis chinensis]|uniref:Neprosin PEP catalytic domain-containing protein n=1 Tax=Coptis chinensis TaxID=261450 RepID=A0A835LJV1_9MAGN|nr:hypothetical protein IFM89_037434 [Coptis chinensis]